MSWTKLPCPDRADLKAGDTLVNRYGLILHVRRIEKRGVVGPLGADIHERLHEWDEVLTQWRLP